METGELEEISKDTPQNGAGNDTNVGGTLAIMAAVVVSVLLAAVLLYTVIGGSDETAEDTPATTVATVIEPTTDTVPAPIFNPPSQPDPSMERWHQEQIPLLVRLGSTLGTLPGSKFELVRLQCQRALDTAQELRRAPAPTRESVVKALDLWLLSVEDAADYCINGIEDGGPEDARITAVRERLLATGPYFQMFLEDMSQYVDLRVPSD
jgi:ABC-type cobalt transport system substrate-binding protein